MTEVLTHEALNAERQRIEAQHKAEREKQEAIAAEQRKAQEAADKLKREKIDADAVNTLAREEMIDLLLTSYWDKAEKAKSYLRRLPTQPNRHLFAVNSKQEGFFLIWGAPDKPSALTKAAFKEIAEESRQAGLAPRYHVYAALAPYTGSSVEFYKIPDRVLEHIGFSQRQDSFNNENDTDALSATGSVTTNFISNQSGTTARLRQCHQRGSGKSLHSGVHGGPGESIMSKLTKIFVTKYALIAGPQVVMAEIKYEGNTAFWWAGGYYHSAHGKDFWLTEQEALADCERRRKAKLASIDKQAKKLKAITFTIKDPADGQ